MVTKEDLKQIVILTYLTDPMLDNLTQIIVGSIKPGFSFGWSAMIEDSFYTSDAICVEPSEIYSFKRVRIQKLFVQDPEMGLRMYQRLLVIIKKRHDHRTDQFRQAIMNHPDMQNLFST
jgi:CRP-like cAMP-binding protein